MTTTLSHQPDLSLQSSTEVCVVGAGITGLTCAYLAARAGAEVMVLGGPAHEPDGFVPLGSVLGGHVAEVERSRGTAAARLWVHARARAIDLIETISADEAIACGFRRIDGFAVRPAAALEAEAAAARRVGLHPEYVELPASSILPGPALRYEDQASVHAARYVAGLVRAVRSLGVVVRNDLGVLRVTEGWPPRVLAEGGRVVTAGHVVVTEAAEGRIHRRAPAPPAIVWTVSARVRSTQAPAVFWTDDPLSYAHVLPTLERDARTVVVGEGLARAIDPAVEWTHRRAEHDVDPVDGSFPPPHLRPDAPGVSVTDASTGTLRGTVAAMMFMVRVGGAYGG